MDLYDIIVFLSCRGSSPKVFQKFLINEILVNCIKNNWFFFFDIDNIKAKMSSLLKFDGIFLDLCEATWWGEIQKGAQVTLFDSFYKNLLPLSHTES